MSDGLAIDGVSKAYGDIQALNEVSFTVGSGELFGFVGSNGAGKTTTMRIILGVLASDAGTVTLDGQVVDDAVRRRIGYMPAERGLYPKMKVGEQLTYLARLHGLSVTQAAESVRAWTERLGVDHRIGDSVDTLSTGNQQRVQLAAALVHDPDLLILDEPFSGLDPAAVDVMSEVLRHKSEAGVPVLFSSHQLELVEELCDRVGIIADGSLLAVGAVDELKADQPRRLDVVLGVAAPADWADAVAGVTTISADGTRFILELASAADDQAVLDAARAIGPVRDFHPRRPRLADLYREVVGA